MDHKKTIPASNKTSEQLLIDSLQEIQRMEDSQQAQADESKRFDQLRHLHAKLQVKNTLLEQLKIMLVEVQDTVTQLQCLADPTVNTALRLRQEISGEEILIAEYTRIGLQHLDASSVSISGIVNELVRSNDSM